MASTCCLKSAPKSGAAEARSQELPGVGSDGHRLGRQIQLDAGSGQVLERLDARRVIVGQDDDKAVVGEDGRFVGEKTRLLGQVHLLLISGGEDIGWRPLLQLRP